MHIHTLNTLKHVLSHMRIAFARIHICIYIFVYAYQSVYRPTHLRTFTHAHAQARINRDHIKIR